MPAYQTFIRPDLYGHADRQALSNDVMNIHCDVTGAPPSYVHAIFIEDPNLDSDVFVFASIRAGRTTAQKQEIADRLTTRLVAHGADADRVSVTIRDVEASWNMEGGTVMPEPGSTEEAAYLEAHHSSM